VEHFWARAVLQKCQNTLNVSRAALGVPLFVFFLVKSLLKLYQILNFSKIGIAAAEQRSLDKASGFGHYTGMTLMTIEDLVTTASLARLHLDKAELEQAFPAFEQMLAFFADMQNADDDTAAFGASIAGLSRDARESVPALFRGDDPAGADRYNPAFSLNERFLENTGERDGPFMVVPNVL
jgi:aspartyl-tRNA(Asn)/glutamyl-tRNA(Gln) amidotransferase subunit C